jgi:hypothetical protein
MCLVVTSTCPGLIPIFQYYKKIVFAKTFGKHILLMALRTGFSLNATAELFGDAQGSCINHRVVAAGPTMRCQDQSHHNAGVHGHQDEDS